jgi:hypothetical protein
MVSRRAAPAFAGRIERGSVLMLMPAAVLSVILLGSIAVDFAVVHLGERDLVTVAAAAANDAATYGIDQERFRQDGAIRLDRQRVLEAVRRSLSAHGAEVEVTEVDVEVDDATATVRVTLAGRVDYIFARAIPGVDHSTTIRATSEAVATTIGP